MASTPQAIIAFCNAKIEKCVIQRCAVFFLFFFSVLKFGTKTEKVMTEPSSTAVVKEVTTIAANSLLPT